MTVRLCVLLFAVLALALGHPHGKKEDDYGMSMGDFGESMKDMEKIIEAVKAIREHTENMVDVEEVKSVHAEFIKFAKERHMYEVVKSMGEMKDFVKVAFKNFVEACMKKFMNEAMTKHFMGHEDDDEDDMMKKFMEMVIKHKKASEHDEEEKKEMMKKFFEMALMMHMHEDESEESKDDDSMYEDKEEMMKKMMKMMIMKRMKEKYDVKVDMKKKFMDMVINKYRLCGEMDGSHGMCHHEDDDKMDHYKLKLVAAWKKFMEFELAFMEQTNVLRLGLDKKITTRLFFEIFLRFMHRNKEMDMGKMEDKSDSSEEKYYDMSGEKKDEDKYDSIKEAFLKYIKEHKEEGYMHDTDKMESMKDMDKIVKVGKVVHEYTKSMVDAEEVKHVHAEFVKFAKARHMYEVAKAMEEKEEFTKMAFKQFVMDCMRQYLKETMMKHFSMEKDEYHEYMKKKFMKEIMMKFLGGEGDKYEEEEECDDEKYDHNSKVMMAWKKFYAFEMAVMEEFNTLRLGLDKKITIKIFFEIFLRFNARMTHIGGEEKEDKHDDFKAEFAKFVKSMGHD